MRVGFLLRARSSHIGELKTTVGDLGTMDELPVDGAVTAPMNAGQMLHAGTLPTFPVPLCTFDPPNLPPLHRLARSSPDEK